MSLKNKIKIGIKKKEDAPNLPARRLVGEMIIKSIMDEKFSELIASNVEFRDLLVEEHQYRKKRGKVIFGLLILIAVVIAGSAVMLKFSLQSDMKKVVTGEMSYFKNREKDLETTRSMLIPMQKNVERNLNQVSAELSLNRGYVDVIALENLARDGSKTAFDELARIIARGGDKAVFADKKMADLKEYFAMFAEPKHQNVHLGDLAITKNGTNVSSDSLSTMDLIQLLKFPNVTMISAYQILSLLWDKNITKADEVELLNILTKSQNLPASIAACSYMKRFYKQPTSMFEFDQWKLFLAKKVFYAKQ
ncbi:MAG: hypothetical protein ACOYNS_14710 [Bacteroidota bacterium]